MRKQIPMLRSLDPYHQRIGYLGVLTKVANRGLDTANALKARLEDILYKKIYPDNPIFNMLLSRLNLSRKKLLDEKSLKRKQEEDPAQILRKHSEEAEWRFLSELWLYDDVMPSPRGYVGREKVERVIDFGRWTAVLSPMLELSDTGYVIRLLLEEIEAGQSVSAAMNWMNPNARASLPLMYIRILLSSEALWPFLVCELVKQSDSGIHLTTQGENSLLRIALKRMIQEVGDNTDIDDVMQMREITEFQRSIEANAKTAENYLRPRMEILTDLGLVKRDDNEKKGSSFAWKVTDRTRLLSEEWKYLAVNSPPISEYLEEQFIGSMARIYTIKCRKTELMEEHLLWFSKAYLRIGRELGFTPGSTVAILACMLAYEDGIIIEISDMFDSLYASPKTKWSEYLHYSGGSRFDREFMIRVDKEIIPALEKELRR